MKSLFSSALIMQFVAGIAVIGLATSMFGMNGFEYNNEYGIEFVTYANLGSVSATWVERPFGYGMNYTAGNSKADTWDWMTVNLDQRPDGLSLDNWRYTLECEVYVDNFTCGAGDWLRVAVVNSFSLSNGSFRNFELDLMDSAYCDSYDPDPDIIFNGTGLGGDTCEYKFLSVDLDTWVHVEFCFNDWACNTWGGSCLNGADLLIFAVVVEMDRPAVRASAGVLVENMTISRVWTI